MIAEENMIYRHCYVNRAHISILIFTISYGTISTRFDTILSFVEGSNDQYGIRNT